MNLNFPIIDDEETINRVSKAIEEINTNTITTTVMKFGEVNKNGRSYNGTISFNGPYVKQVITKNTTRWE